MSTGPIKQFVDFTATGDTNQNEPEAIEPIENGEDVTAGVGGIANRPSENLRNRSEVLRDVLADLLYLADADRHLFLGGPGKVTWPGVAPGNSGIPVLSDSIAIIPALTPGYAQVPPVPPVASAYGTLLLLRADSTPDMGITLTSRRRSYAGGDRINVTVEAGTTLAVTVAADGRTVTVVTPATSTLAEVRDAINALTADSPATQLLTAVVSGGAAESDLILDTQAKQFISGNYDGEAHLITPANLATFFATSANVLREGDTLCVWFDYLRDPNLPPTLGGRREAIPENANTTVPAGSFFNSRVHPERLVNALPICKVIVGQLYFINGAQVPEGATTYALTDTQFTGGSAWKDGTTNPATSVDLQLKKFITDLIADAGAARIGAAARTAWLGGRTNDAASIFAAIDKIITDLAAVTVGDDGAERIGAAVATDLTAGSIRSQLDELATNWAKLARENTFTAKQSIKQIEMDQLVDTDTNARLPRIKATTRDALAAYTLQIEWYTDHYSVRVYTHYNSFLQITVNARYDGSQWVKDNNSNQSWSLTLGLTTGFMVEYQDHTIDTWTAWKKLLTTFDGTASTGTQIKVNEDAAGTADSAVAHRGNVFDVGGTERSGWTDCLNNLGHYQNKGVYFKDEFFALDANLFIENGDVTISSAAGYRHSAKLTATDGVGVANLLPNDVLQTWKIADKVAVQWRTKFVFGASGWPTYTTGHYNFGLGRPAAALLAGWVVYDTYVGIFPTDTAPAHETLFANDLVEDTWYYFTTAFVPDATTPANYNLLWWVTDDVDFANATYYKHGVLTTLTASAWAYAGPLAYVAPASSGESRSMYIDYVEVWGKNRSNGT